MSRRIPKSRALLGLGLAVCPALFCSKDQATQPGDAFPGITRTDGAGRILSLDPDDWEHDTAWPYENLYRALQGALTKNSPGAARFHAPSTNYNISPAFPNPTSGPCTILLMLPEPSEAFVVLIDGARRVVRTWVLRKCLPEGHHTLYFDGVGDNGRLLPRGPYRCVYRFENGGYGVFHGHGDIRIGP